ncbi:MAG TPA: hypothetical protein DDY39_06760 [Nitrospira sp.]|nr:hypothetical protein [Nitrospira sp.]
MFPSELFSLFPPFPREHRVFVAMSFAAPFRYRWEAVIEPAIISAGLKPFRVDASTVSDSILTQILRGISDSRLVFADITSLSGYRNSNVMYEIGLAHAVRQPQEVILFRSDNEHLLFDVAHVRVNHYAPDTNEADSKASIVKALTEAMAEINQCKAIAVHKALDALDQHAFDLLLDAMKGAIRYPQLKTMRDHLVNAPKVSALYKLLELGLIKMQYPTFTVEDLQSGKLDRPLEDLVAYQLTGLGHAVTGSLPIKLGFDKIVQDPAKRMIADEIFSKYDDPPLLPAKPETDESRPPSP